MELLERRSRKAEFPGSWKVQQKDQEGPGTVPPGKTHNPLDKAWTSWDS